MAKLVDSLGQLKLVNLPTTVAELMLEHPGFAIAPVDELRETRRITAMRADDVLLGRKVYLLVPVDKVNSRLTDLQMAAIDSIVCSCNGKVGGRTRGGSKISPDLEANNGLDGQSLEDLVKDLSGKCTGLTGQRKRFCKVWEPVLEPILEGC
uniref:Uncharacterized protein n=1 Tax=Chenopodium quinoa TaxID=63459 RepID=A0A803M7K1_CHEQI